MGRQFNGLWRGVHGWRRGAALLVLVFSASACTPVLDWRTVSVGRMSAWLPCKPDRAQRSVDLAGMALEMEMAGCEAGGALFAVSRVYVPEAARASAVVQAWRTAATATMRATDVREVAAQPPSENPENSQTPAYAAHAGPAPQRWVAQGVRSDGQPVQAQWGWYIEGAEVFHFAVYAAQVSADMQEHFFNERQLR